MRNFLFFPYSLFLYCLLFTGACQRFTQDFAGTSVVCGIRPEAMPSDRTLFKIVSPEGQDLSPQELTVTHARYRDARDGVHDLQLSARGCAFVPDEAELVQVYTLNLKAQFTLPLPPARERPRFMQERLRPSPRFQAELLCPTDGFFAHDRLDFPARVVSDGDITGVALKILARNNETRADVTVFEKPLGMSLVDWPQALHTGLLKEGSYALRLEVTQNFQGWDQTESSSTTFCPLVILHKAPSIKGRQELVQGGRSVLARNEDLPWKGSDSFTQLSVCKEPRGRDEDLISSDQDGCEARSLCQSPEAFRPIFGQIADETGVFDYFIKARDRTGRDSAVLCQRVVVTEPQNFLSLDWNESSWNQPAAVMSPARPSIQAQVRVRHAEQQDSDILNRLQCRLDFLVNGKTVLPGKDVICSSGRCQGQTLDQYRPCDAKITAGISDFFTQQDAKASLLRLHVKASDGSGQVNEVVRSVWIHPQRFTASVERLYPNGNDGGMSSLARSRDGHLLASFASNVAMRTESDPKWRLALMPFSFPYTSTQVLQTREGEVYGVGAGKMNEGSRPVEIARWNGEGFTGMAVHPLVKECTLGILPHPVKGFWCAAGSKVLHYHDETWDVLDWAQEEGSTNQATPCGLWGSSPVQHNQASAAGQLWTICLDGRLLTRVPGGAWTLLAKDMNAYSEIKADTQSRLWAVRSEWKSRNRWDVNVRVIAEGRDQELPALTLFTHRSPAFSVVANDQLLIQDMTWNEATQSWERFPGLAEAFPKENPLVFATNDQRLGVLAQGGALLWEAGQFRLFPHAWLNLSNNLTDRELVSFIGADEVVMGAQALRANFAVYRMLNRHWNSMGFEVDLFDKAAFTSILQQWTEDNGAATFLMYNRGLVTSTPEGAWLDRTADRSLADIFTAERFNTDHYVMSDTKSVFRLQGSKVTAVDIPASETGGMFVLKNHSTGRIWAYNYGSTSVWQIAEYSVTSFELPEPVYSASVVNERTLFNAGGPVSYQFSPTSPSYEKIAALDLGVPDGARWTPVAAFKKQWPQPSKTDKDDILVLEADFSGFILKADGTRSPFQAPSLPNLANVGLLFKVQDNTYVLTTTNDGGVFLGDGQNWQKIVDPVAITREFPDVGTFYTVHVDLDPAFRLWVSGKPMNLLQLDLSRFLQP